MEVCAYADMTRNNKRTKDFSFVMAGMVVLALGSAGALFHYLSPRIKLLPLDSSSAVARRSHSGRWSRQFALKVLGRSLLCGPLCISAFFAFNRLCTKSVLYNY